MKRPFLRSLTLLLLLLYVISPTSLSAQSLEELRNEVKELKAQVNELKNLISEQNQALKEKKSTALSDNTKSPDTMITQETRDTTYKQLGAWKIPVSKKSAWRFLPDISVNGVFSAAVFREDLPESGPNPFRTGFNLQEIEIAFQSIIDPYVRADVFLSVSEEGLELEEAYITTLSLPKGLQLKAGQYLLPFGRQNQKHVESWPFVNDMLINEFLLGEEQFRDLGIELSYLFPTPFFFQFQGNFTQGNQTENFNGERKQDFAYTFRLSGSTDIAQDLTLLMGASTALGFNDTASGNSTYLVGGDFLLKWKPSRKTSIEWQSEYIYRRREVPEAVENLGGIYTYLLGQWTPRWGAGFRFDYLGFPQNGPREFRLSPMVLFKASEFFQVRAQYDYINVDGQDPNHAGFLQWIFTMGVHGPHPF